jgi:sugar (pentulose or hexulose) kinase
MSKDVLLGIDIGSTTIRCCIFDTNAQQLFEVSRPTAKVRLNLNDRQHANRAWDADSLWNLIITIMQEIGSIIKVQNFNPLGVAVSSVGCTPVMLDKLGIPLFPIISQKTGVSSLFQKYQREYTEMDFQRITGYPLETTCPVFVWALLKTQYPDEFERIDTILPVSNFISYKFTGEKITDRSIVASFGLWDHTQNRPWEKLLADLGLNSSVFGKIGNGGEFIGMTTPEFTSLINFPEPLPVYSGGHDYLCAALAVDCIHPGPIFNIEGTFEIYATFYPTPWEKLKGDQTRALIDVHVVPDSYSLMTERIGSGQIEWLRRLIYHASGDQKAQVTSDWDFIVSEMQQLQDEDLRDEVFIPYIFGELFPVSNNNIFGGILGLGRSSTRASIMRAAILSHCYESKQMIDFHRKNCQGEIDHIISVGGITQNNYWMQMKADIIGIPIIVPVVKEASALGAALLAGLGAGIYHEYQQLGEIVHVNGFVTYDPDVSRSGRYMEYYREKYLPAKKNASRV